MQTPSSAKRGHSPLAGGVKKATGDTCGLGAWPVLLRGLFDVPKHLGKRNTELLIYFKSVAGRASSPKAISLERFDHLELEFQRAAAG